MGHLGRLAAALTALVLLSVALATSPSDAASTNERLSDAMSAFRDHAIKLRAVEARLLTAREERTAATVGLDEARFVGRMLAEQLEQERSGLTAVGVLAYTRMGEIDGLGLDPPTRVFASRTAKYRDLRAQFTSATNAIASAERRLERASAAVDREIAARSRALEPTRASAGAVESLLAQARITSLSAPVHLAALDAADASAAGTPECHLSAAVLASQAHVDGLDRAGVLDEDGSLLLVELEDRFLATADELCAGGTDLARFGSLRTAIERSSGGRGRANAVLALAKRLSLNGSLRFGFVPTDPAIALHAGGAGGLVRAREGSTIADMLAWSRARLGTPYSQCLGDARPDDPPCPEGTDRFGDGFFDCSGFVSAAFASIGVSVPTTTYAMDADADFMATQVATSIDRTVLRPGDVLLMDGHVAIWTGESRIIHANGTALVEERPPEWIRNAVYAVLRPATTA